MVCQVLVLVLLLPRGVLAFMMILDVQVTGIALNLNLEPMVNLVHQLVLLIVKMMKKLVLEEHLLRVVLYLINVSQSYWQQVVRTLVLIHLVLPLLKLVPEALMKPQNVQLTLIALNLNLETMAKLAHYFVRHLGPVHQVCQHVLEKWIQMVAKLLKILVRQVCIL